MSVRAGVIAIAAVALGLSLAGCGSDTKSEPSAKESATSSEATSTKTSAALHPPRRQPAATELHDRRLHPRQRHRRDTGQARGPRRTHHRPAVPTRMGGRGKPHPAVGLQRISRYRSSVCRKSAHRHRAGVQATGNVDPAKILEFAPGEIRNLPGYDGAKEGSPASSAVSTRHRSAAPIPRTASSAPSPRRQSSSRARAGCLSCSSTPTASKTRWAP